MAGARMSARGLLLLPLVLLALFAGQVGLCVISYLFGFLFLPLTKPARGFEFPHPLLIPTDAAIDRWYADWVK